MACATQGHKFFMWLDNKETSNNNNFRQGGWKRKAGAAPYFTRNSYDDSNKENIPLNPDAFKNASPYLLGNPAEKKQKSDSDQLALLLLQKQLDTQEKSMLSVMHSMQQQLDQLTQQNKSILDLIKEATAPDSE